MHRRAPDSADSWMVAKHWERVMPHTTKVLVRSNGTDAVSMAEDRAPAQRNSLTPQGSARVQKRPRSRQNAADEPADLPTAVPPRKKPRQGLHPACILPARSLGVCRWTTSKATLQEGHSDHLVAVCRQSVIPAISKGRGMLQTGGNEPQPAPAAGPPFQKLWQIVCSPLSCCRRSASWERDLPLTLLCMSL